MIKEYRAYDQQLHVPPLATGRTWHEWILWMLKERRQVFVTDKEMEAWKVEGQTRVSGEKKR